ncbi:MAG: hypothetical protein Kow00109_14540 [Acidobacteriota bacterium]
MEFGRPPVSREALSSGAPAWHRGAAWRDFLAGTSWGDFLGTVPSNRLLLEFQDQSWLLVRNARDGRHVTGYHARRGSTEVFFYPESELQDAGLAVGERRLLPW